MATIITPASIRDASGVSAPITSSNPQTNSTVETKTAVISGKGTCASINVWRISCCRVALKSLARPERKNSKPHSDTREENADPFQRMQFADEDRCARHHSNSKSQLASRQ